MWANEAIVLNRNTRNHYLQTNDWYWTELLLFDSNNWNHLREETIAIIVGKQISSNSFNNEITYKLFTYIT